MKTPAFELDDKKQKPTNRRIGYIKRVFIRSVKTNPLEIYFFQVAGRACDYAGHCWLAVTRRKSNRIVAQQKAFSVASLEQVWTVEPVWCIAHNFLNL